MSNFEDGAAFAGGFLAHWGVKGMRWGRRKNDSDGGRNISKDDDSEDFSRTATIALKAKSSGTRSLSNKELRDLVDRINLEQNFGRVTTPEAKRSSPMKTGITYIGQKIKKTGDMTVDTILKTAVQIKVTEDLKKKLATKPNPNSQLKLFDFS